MPVPMPAPRATPARTAPPPPPMASLDARASRLDPGRLVLPRPLWRLAPGTPPALAFLHLAPDAAGLAKALAVPPGSDLAHHLAEGAAIRLIEALGDPARAQALLGTLTAPVLIDAPARITITRPLAAAGMMPVLALPLPSVADPEEFAVRAVALRGQGCLVALRGLSAPVLRWLCPHVVAADWFVLDWSDALGEPAIAKALRPIDPGRIILTGCETQAALDWGFARDIRVFGGPLLDAMPAGARA